ncbi:MAG: helix-turn-helix domain-containing protein [Alphaproteobacteria bacterium]|nr:helix-turn-helix domain-containing protein [Alphaproteobacteria bacterium]
MNKLLNTKEVAKYLDVACSTLIEYRRKGIGPAYIKLGHLVRYKVEDVELWLKQKSEQI